MGLHRPDILIPEKYNDADSKRLYINKSKAMLVGFRIGWDTFDLAAEFRMHEREILRRIGMARDRERSAQ